MIEITSWLRIEDDEIVEKATRAIMQDLRAGGEQLGGPKPFAPADRSRFLQALHEAIVRNRTKR
jgi:uncharacterized protein YaiI (UPF0178 family)